jgi:hypothetical protein
MRLLEAGCFSSIASDLMGLGSRLPPQFGQTPSNTSSTHFRQKVHSNVQIIASWVSGGRSRAQFSQFGRSSSIGLILQALPPASVAPSTRMMPASTLALFSGVSS